MGIRYVVINRMRGNILRAGKLYPYPYDRQAEWHRAVF